jgi:hypothetical protein
MHRSPPSISYMEDIVIDINIALMLKFIGIRPSYKQSVSEQSLDLAADVFYGSANGAFSGLFKP